MGKIETWVKQLLVVSDISSIYKSTAHDTVRWYPFQQVNAIFTRADHDMIL